MDNQFIYTNRQIVTRLIYLKGQLLPLKFYKKMNSDINEDPNYSYDIIHNTLVTLNYTKS